MIKAFVESNLPLKILVTFLFLAILLLGACGKRGDLDPPHEDRYQRQYPHS